MAIKQIGTTTSRISEIAATIAISVEQQGGATQEIARNVEQAAQGISEVATYIVDRLCFGESAFLDSVFVWRSNRLKLEVGRFLDKVRAA